jgi:DNA polymerase-3 subunit beta
MKLSCLQENLNKGLTTVSRLVATKGTLEILSHILIATSEGRLKLSATNLEIGINYKIGAKIDEEGAITVPARLFSEFVAQLPSGKVDLTLEEDTLITKIDHFQSQIKGLSAEEFPLIPKIKEKALFKVKAGDLKAAINMVSFAAALDEARPVLSGIYFKVEKGKLTLVSTDGYRLTEKSLKIDTKEDAKKDAIVPARSLTEFSRILDDPEKEVSVYLDDTQIMLETDEVEFTSRLVEGKFPDYKEIIPTGFETKAVAPITEFTKIIKVAALFARESAGSVTLEVKQKGFIEANSASSQFGDSNASCEASVEGKDADIVFNSKYLIDVLNNLNDGNIVLEMSGKLNPGVIRKEGDKSFVYVIMPLRA